jgi:hypothetical protein
MQLASQWWHSLVCCHTQLRCEKAQRFCKTKKKRRRKKLELLAEMSGARAGLNVSRDQRPILAPSVGASGSSVLTHLADDESKQLG